MAYLFSLNIEVNIHITVEYFLDTFLESALKNKTMHQKCYVKKKITQIVKITYLP